ncbi:MAG: VOC family protein [Actinobacteria bacterium]|nr:VOC family protein [Actinomycetota bacterium]
MSEPALFAYLSYRDTPAALEWFQALGFTVSIRQDGPNGTVAHAEVRLGSVVLMVASADAEYDVPALRGNSTGGGLYLLVDDVDAVHSRALAAGAREVFGPEPTGWGSRRSRVLDAEGHEWSFGSYRPGQGWR